MIGSKGSKVTVMRAGSLVRVNLPKFDGKMGLGVVTHFQVIYYDKTPYHMVWVDMILDGVNRPFEAENLEVLPKIVNGRDNEFVASLLNEAS